MKSAVKKLGMVEYGASIRPKATSLMEITTGYRWLSQYISIMRTVLEEKQRKKTRKYSKFQNADYPARELVFRLKTNRGGPPQRR